MEIRTTTRLRSWGNSLGLVIPKEEALKAGLTAGVEVEITVRPRNALKELFGTVKFGMSTEQLLKEVDRELDPDLVKRR